MNFSENLQSNLKYAAGGLTVAAVMLGAGFASHSYTLQSQENTELRQHVDEFKMISRDRQSQIDALVMENYTLKKQLVELENKIAYEEEQKQLSTMDVVVTAYDLSVQSCGKSVGSHGYGVTASGFNLAGHTLESARAIAVDPSVIPMGSKVELAFDEPAMQKYNGVYTAVDTGGAIKGNKIDLFMGDFGNASEVAMIDEFGIQNAKARVL